MRGQSASLTLQPEAFLEGLSLGWCRDIGAGLSGYGRLITGTAGVLAMAAALVCGIIVGVIGLTRSEGLSSGFSAADQMFLATTDPLVRLPAVPQPKGLAQPNKAARLAVTVPRQDLTEDAIVAAYRREVATEITRQAIASALAAAPTDTAPVNAPPPAAGRSVVADATAPLDRPFPLPPIKPLFERRHLEPSAPRKPVQLANVPDQPSPGESVTEPLARRAPPANMSLPGHGSRMAVYDISAGVVYLPDGEKLEAHSGVGRMRDNPRFVNVKMLGPTPPATYALSLREATFHGVAALRLTPVNGVAPYGREGLLAHTYMLRNRGDSNGCVVFADYERFLKAFRSNEINLIQVVPQLQSQDRITLLDLMPARG